MNYASNNYPSGEAVVINGRPCRIGEILNTGADGRVFNADYDGSIDSAVVKYFACQYEDEIWRSALKEIEAMQRLKKCRFTVNIIGYCIKKRSDEVMEIFILMPKLKSCEELFQSEMLDLADILKMAEDILQALKFLKKFGWVHCDIKPSNIFLDRDAWQIGDFGCIQPYGRCLRAGSYAYRSPEAERGEAVDIRSDIYSLGIVLYKLLSGGRLPFCGLPASEMSEQEVWNAIEKRLGGESFDGIEGISDELNSLIAEMCDFEQKNRPKSIQKLILSIKNTAK